MADADGRDSEVQSSPVCRRSVLRRSSVRVRPRRRAGRRPAPGEPLECGNSPRSVRRPRLTTSIALLFTRARFPEFVQGARIHKEPTRRGRGLSATATAAPRSVEIRGRFQRRGGKSFAAVVAAASESHQDLYTPPSRRRRLGAREDEGRLLRRPRPELISLVPSLAPSLRPSFTLSFLEHIYRTAAVA